MASEDNQRELSRLWRVLRTTRQMCADRGYEIPEDECNLSLEEFRVKYADEHGVPQRERMSFTARPTPEMEHRYAPLARGTNPPTGSDIGTVHVEFSGEPNVGIKHIKAFAQVLSEKNFQTGIYVTNAAPTSSALKIIPSLQPIVMEIFREDDLLVNISKHELVPKHILLSKEEKKSLLERYRLRETQLPRIRLDDPMAKYLGLKRGDVIKIIRKSETAGRYASYRFAFG